MRRRRFDDLVGRAVVILKEDRRLVGLDALRLALGRAAVMRALTGEFRAFIPPRKLWRGDGGPVPSFCDELVAAVALRLRLDGFVEAA